LTRVVDLPDDDPKAVEDVLHHLYTGYYRIVRPHEISLEHLLRHAGIYALADKWDMQPLKRLALDQFLEDGTGVMAGITLIKVAEQIYLRFSEQDDLRLAAVSLIKAHSDESPFCAEDVKRMNDVPGLARDLLPLYMRIGTIGCDPLRILTCSGCGTPRDELIDCPLNANCWCRDCGDFS